MLNKPLLGQSAGFQLSLTARKLSQLFGLRLKPYQITPEQWLVLTCIREHQGIIQKAIAEQTGKDQPTITRILDALEKKSWISKQADAKDRRSFIVHITPSGSQLLEQTNGIEEQVVAQATAGIDGPQLTELFKLLLHIRGNTNSLINQEQEKEHVRHTRKY